MIIQTGLRTDIPAFYTPWLLRRLEEGYVLVRNPYNPSSVTRYSLSPEVVDVIAFCTKNPAPMLPHMDALAPYGQYWYVTITPYGPDIEPNVPPKEQVMADLLRLSAVIGPDCVGWRYDPILLTETYTVERHIGDFEQMARTLAGSTYVCVISFIDLYQKVRRNFPEAREVTEAARVELGKAFVEIGRRYGMTIKSCAEGDLLAPYGVDCTGCMTISTYENALHARLNAPKRRETTRECACHLTCDIGAYDTCGHLCRYCYANSDPAAAMRNLKSHDPASPLLLGRLQPGDKVHEAKQKSWRDGQIRLDL